jgi:hypothetical protein
MKSHKDNEIDIAKEVDSQLSEDVLKRADEFLTISKRTVGDSFSYKWFNTEITATVSDTYKGDTMPLNSAYVLRILFSDGNNKFLNFRSMGECMDARDQLLKTSQLDLESPKIKEVEFKTPQGGSITQYYPLKKT